VSWIPPGYVSVVSLVREHGRDKVRSDLFEERLKAFEWDGTAPSLTPIEPRLWCYYDADGWLTSGMIPHHCEECRPNMVIVRVEEEAKPQPATGGAYVSPYMQLMCEAVRRFAISEERWPKKEDLEQYFRAQKVDGTPVSANLASQLATLCRPPAAKRGGNTKKG
jgi:hypothetical protein